MKDKSIILVEDESYTRASLKFILQHIGYSVKDFQSGQEAMEYLATDDDTSGRTNLIIADLCRPANIGPDFIKALQAGIIEVPTLGITSLPGKNGEISIEGPGEQLKNSFNTDLFVECVRHLLESYTGRPPERNFIQVPWFLFNRKECSNCGQC